MKVATSHLVPGHVIHGFGVVAKVKEAFESATVDVTFEPAPYGCYKGSTQRWHYRTLWSCRDELYDV